jgi:hypothetical protein
LFVLRPLCEIAGDARIPPEGLTVQSLLARHASPDTGIYECRTAWHPLCGPSRRPVG